jgi:hypothetical protein
MWLVVRRRSIISMMEVSEATCEIPMQILPNLSFLEWGKKYICCKCDEFVARKIESKSEFAYGWRFLLVLRNNVGPESH